MPGLSASVITTVEVELSTKLKKQLRAKLIEYHTKYADAKRLKGELSDDKKTLETLFADADEYAALETGVRVETPFGTVPMKMVTGKTAPKLNIKKLMIRCKLTTHDIEACTDPAKDKKPYLGIWLPDDDNENDN